MRISLRGKIIGSFALIVLLSLGTAVGIGSRLMKDRYTDYSYRMDINRARAMTRFLGEWIVNPEAYGEHLPLFAPMPVPIPMMKPEGGIRSDSNHRDFSASDSRGWMNRMMDRMEVSDRHGEDPGSPPAMDSILITDVQGQVLLDTADFGKEFLSPTGRDSVEVRRENALVGYLYLGHMIPGEGESATGEFLRVVGRTTWLFTAVVFLLAMVLGLLLTRHIVRPVKALNSATADVAKGNLEVRLPGERRDEMGDLARAFNAMAESLDMADKQRRRLIADSAHELRTPVSLIRTRIEMMEEGVYPMDAAGLAALSEESDRLVKLVEELRVLADLESPDKSEDFEALNPRRLVFNVIDAVQPALDRGEITVTTDFESVSETIPGEASQLHRLFSNLLGNAMRYAESRISVSGRTIEGHLEFRVEDDGTGIPEAHLDRVFDRYYRVDASRSRDSGGSGLGLAICREIAHTHGGSIHAGCSATLGGASLTVILPQGELSPESI